MLKPKLFYRQKVLLALAEAFDEALPRVDFMKLLFLLCKEGKQDFYSFFPYKYGCFSFQVYQDWQYLKNNKMMRDGDCFQKNEACPGTLSDLRPGDKRMIALFSEKYARLRGDALVHKTYLEYPEYTRKSEIKNRILTPAERKAIDLALQPNYQPREKCVFTIGYESISIDEYLHRLIRHGINLVCDVRAKPRSMKYDFNDKRLANVLQQVNIAYQGIPGLGIPSSLRNDLGSEDSYQRLFDFYEAQILPKRKQEIADIAQEINSGNKTALTCFEKNPEHCHRLRIAARLSRDFHFHTVNIVR
jgi:hypothetical protein